MSTSWVSGVGVWETPANWSTTLPNSVPDGSSIGDTAHTTAPVVTASVSNANAIFNGHLLVGADRQGGLVVTAGRTLMGAATQFWASQLIVGDAGAGTFLAEESAQVSTTDLIAGRQSGASGSIVLSDGGTFLFSQITEIGVAGTADMTIQNGALMTTSWYADIGYSPGGKGEVYVTGAGSRWNAGSLAIGSTQSTGLLNVSNGGIVYADRTRPGRDVVRIDTLGRLEGDGGTLQVVLGMLVNRGTIAPGPGLGSLTIDGSVDFYTSGRLEIDIFGPPSSSLNDLLVVTGFAVLSGTLVLDFTNYTPAFGSTYTYLAANAIFGDFTNFSVIGLNPAFVQFDTPNGQFTIIPEPATASLLGLAGLALLRRRHSGLRSGTD